MRQSSNFALLQVPPAAKVDRVRRRFLEESRDSTGRTKPQFVLALFGVGLGPGRKVHVTARALALSSTFSVVAFRFYLGFRRRSFSIAAFRMVHGGTTTPTAVQSTKRMHGNLRCPGSFSEILFIPSSQLRKLFCSDVLGKMENSSTCREAIAALGRDI